MAGDRFLGPTALAWLADTAADHLARGERFTVYLPLGYRKTRSETLEARQVRAEATIADLVGNLRLRHPRVEFDHRRLDVARFQINLVLTPAHEWHPTPDHETPDPLTVRSDASFADDGRARAGISITARRRSYAVDLSGMGLEGSAQAEFIALALAMLVGVSERTPLTVLGDEETAIRHARLLHTGQMPLWVVESGSDLAQRIAVAAMTAVRLRHVHIRHVQRRYVERAHTEAAVNVAHGSLVQPRNFARHQGIQLSWYDKARGLVRHMPNIPVAAHRSPG
ncbi:hypothetical protein [Streptomyces sp. NBC_01304]|uniref:hypothetical protein n=1 Tax=Streptomyces sp. NBC_01304 TaxID=2903818 RepID=UPI002E0E27CC|nr:hypothetical protein OG430_48585 [Streptomyces sp. NBC_01304]